MKAILLLLMLLLTLNAKEASKSQQYHVEIINQDTKKNLFGKVLFKIKDVVIEVVGKVSIDIFAKEVESFVNANGLNPISLANNFNSKIKILLIDNLYSPKESYRRLEDITINYTLRQEAYNYLLSRDSSEMCLLHTNRASGFNSLNGFAFDTKENVELYLVASLEKIDFKRFKEKHGVLCIRNTLGDNKLNQIRSNPLSEVRRFDISIY